MRLLFISLFIVTCTLQSYPQILRGKIKDTEGNPVAYATVYIREIRQGTVANTKGDYEIRIPEGKYSIIYQSLGYSPETREVTITKTPLTINITLQVQYYQIPEIRITASGEDPAYGIMRKVIGMAPYHLNQVNHYRAEVYLKGTLVINKIPRLLQQSIKVEARRNRGTSVSSATIKEGETYLMESFNEIEFHAPDRYVQRVISLQSTFPEEGGEISPMNFIEASFYQPVIAEMAISPLSPDAFSHYKFRYGGLSVQGEYIINKIYVIPRRKSQQLFEGTIYLVEDLWCLHSVDLVNENIAGRIRVTQLYIPVKDDIWMPVSHKFDMDVSIIGLKADASYSSSIKYSDVTVNTGLEKPRTITEGFSSRPVAAVSRSDTVSSKNREQIEKLLSRKELSNRDMIRLSNLFEKESKNSMPDSVRNSLEIKDRTTYIIEKDAGKKDSAFWAEIRPIPLSENEAYSIRLSGNTRAGLIISSSASDSAATAARIKTKQAFPSQLKNIAFGSTWNDTSGFSFRFDGLFNLRNLRFNTVDGFVYGTEFRISKLWNKTNSLTFYPVICYAFSRETLMWQLNGQYRFDRMRQSQIYWRSGMTSRDIGTAGGINTFLNSMTTLFLKRNYLKLYDSRYLTIGHRREIANGLYIDISAGLDDRRLLENNTYFTLIKHNREYTENIPDNPFLFPLFDTIYGLKNHKHINITTSLEWTPKQKYRIRNNIKIPSGSDYPTFILTYRHIINRYQFEYPAARNYDYLRLEIFRRKEVGAFGEFIWRIRSGGYIENKNISFIDFNHFNSQPLSVLLNNYEDAFRLRDYYSLGTPDFFTEFHLKYTTPYLLIKLLPVLSNTLIRENVSCSFLWPDGKSTYTELGYSISELFFVGEAGVYAGFNNFSFRSAGIRIVLKIN
ncbi:MAG: DUF5686 and carboxypeptidase regulatory-like domain-containing protein [Bacteroidales bacterium]